MSGLRVDTKKRNRNGIAPHNFMLSWLMELLLGFFVLFVILVAVAPEQLMQVLLVIMWGSMGLATVYSVGKAAFSVMS